MPLDPQAGEGDRTEYVLAFYSLSGREHIGQAAAIVYGPGQKPIGVKMIPLRLVNDAPTKAQLHIWAQSIVDRLYRTTFLEEFEREAGFGTLDVKTR